MVTFGSDNDVVVPWFKTVSTRELQCAVFASLFPTTMSEFVDYYALLGIPKTASSDEVRQAYKRESLR